MAFDRVWDSSLLYKLKSHRILGQLFGLVSSFIRNIQFWVDLAGMSSQKYPVNARIPQGFINGPTFSILLFVNGFSEGVLSAILLSMLMILFSILNVIRHLICHNR